MFAARDLATSQMLCHATSSAARVVLLCIALLGAAVAVITLFTGGATTRRLGTAPTLPPRRAVVKVVSPRPARLPAADAEATQPVPTPTASSAPNSPPTTALVKPSPVLNFSFAPPLDDGNVTGSGGANASAAVPPSRMATAFDERLLADRDGAWKRAMAALRAAAAAAAAADGNELLVRRPRDVGSEPSPPTRRRPTTWRLSASQVAQQQRLVPLHAAARRRRPVGVVTERLGPSFAGLANALTANGSVQWQEWLLNETKNVHAVEGFGRAFYRRTLLRIQNRQPLKLGHRGDDVLYRIATECPWFFRDRHFVVPGTQVPDYELWLVHYAKAARTTTLDYRRIDANFTKLSFMHVDDYWTRPTHFDAAFSVSNFEHDGLGRYGDPIDPDGDVKAMRELWTMLRPNATCLLAVPISRGRVVYNAHREYGPAPLARLLVGWRLIKQYGMPRHTGRPSGFLPHQQPVFLLVREDDPDASPVASLVAALPSEYLLLAALGKPPARKKASP